MSRHASKQSTLSHLAEQPVFARCTRKELEAISRLGTTINVDEGYVLTREGRRGYEFFVVIDGEAQCTIGDERVATITAGDFFGEMALLGDGTRSATVVAETKMEVLVIDSREFGGMLDQVPATSRVIMQKMAERLRVAQAH
jgi:CRP/FNR family transcriptional regulator, cyclic AMP receptor protein